MSEQGHNSHSSRPYVVVWLTLLALTGASYAVAVIDLGAWDVPIMLAVACVKATLVVLIFMHLIEQPFATRMVLVVSALFVILLIALTAGDIATRTTFPAGIQGPDSPPPPGTDGPPGEGF